MPVVGCNLANVSETTALGLYGTTQNLCILSITDASSLFWQGWNLEKLTFLGKFFRFLRPTVKVFQVFRF